MCCFDDGAEKLGHAIVVEAEICVRSGRVREIERLGNVGRGTRTSGGGFWVIGRD